MWATSGKPAIAEVGTEWRGLHEGLTGDAMLDEWRGATGIVNGR